MLLLINVEFNVSLSHSFFAICLINQWASFVAKIEKIQIGHGL